MWYNALFALSNCRPANEPHLKNAPFFTEHYVSDKPCYSHICYPTDGGDTSYVWKERFDSNRCCKHHDHSIEIGEELRMQNEEDGANECEEVVAKCILPRRARDPLETIVQVL